MRTRAPSIRGIERLADFRPRDHQIVQLKRRVDRLGGRVTAVVIARGKIHMHYKDVDGVATKLPPERLAA